MKARKELHRKRHWLKDVMSAFEQAATLFNSGSTTLAQVNDLYTLAPLIAAERRGIDDVGMRDTMFSTAVSGVQADFEIDPKTKDDVLFQFVVAYIHSHIAAGMVEEKDADKLMVYISENVDLFQSV
ncbi:MAG: hypothetical protein AAF438_13360 [Pseudomonadota bacterium]